MEVSTLMGVNPTVFVLPFVMLMLYVISGCILYINLLSQEELCIYVERYIDRSEGE